MKSWSAKKPDDAARGDRRPFITDELVDGEDDDRWGSVEDEGQPAQLPRSDREVENRKEGRRTRLQATSLSIGAAGGTSC